MNRPLRVLVIGGTRFIGAAAVRALVARGHTVTVYHRGETHAALPPGVRHLTGDRDALPARRAELAALAPDVVLHQIAYTDAHARDAIETFAGLTPRLVLISSCDVYRAFGRLLGVEPGPPEPTPLTEASPLRAVRVPYGDASEIPGYDKIPVEDALLATDAFETTVLRLPMVYGPDDPRHRLYAYAKPMADGRDAILLGETVAGWRACRGHVRNVAHAIALAVERGARRVYHVADAITHTEQAWVEAIARVHGWHGRVVTLPDDALPEHLRFGGDATQDIDLDPARIRAELGYRDVVALEDGLRETIAHTLARPPPAEEAPPIDYAAEDAALRRADPGG